MVLTPPPDRCLVISLDNIGDLVFASTLFAALHEAWPKTQLAVWCKEYARDIATLLPGAPIVHAADPVWDRAPGRGRGRWRPFLACLATIRRERYPVAIVASRQWRAAAAARLAGAGSQFRIGFTHPKANWGLTDAVPRPPVVEPVTAELARLLTPLLATDRPGCYELDARPLTALRRRFSAARAARGQRAAYVVLHAFAGHPRRCLPIAVWKEIAATLARDGVATVWIGTPAEQATLRTALAEDAGAPTAEYGEDYGATRLLDTAALIADAGAFIGHDSGPLHIAGGLDIPCLGLYLPGEPLRTLPQGRGPSRMLVRRRPEELTAAEVIASFRELWAVTRDG